MPWGTPYRRRSLLRIAAALALLTAADAASGQVGVWTTRGPLGGNIYCLVADPAHPSTLYAGTHQGVIKSDDAGVTWRAVADGMPPGTRVQTIAIDPSTSSTLYAGTVTPDGVESIGIFKSTDGAASWTAINNGLFDPITGVEPLDVVALAMDPSNPSTILAGSRFSEVFKSTDGGASWQSKTFGGYNIGLQTSAFQFDPTNHSKIYAASTAGLLRSTDGGESWSVLGATVSLYTLAIDPSSPSTLYAGNVTGYGLLKSTDGGAHFVSFNKGLPVSGGNEPSVIALALDPSHSSTIYAGTFGDGLYVSTDGAANWTRTDAGIRTSYVSALALPGSAGSAIYAGTLGGGVYRSPDGARTWIQTNDGITQSLVYGMTLDSSSPDTIYAATFEGVQKSTDGGGTWQAANNGLPVDPVGALALSSGTSKTLFAGTLGGGLFKSSDGGASWTASTQGLTDSYIASIAIDPTSSSTLYAGTAHLDGSSQRVYKSTDAGATWTQTSLNAQSFTVDFIAVNPANTAQVVAGSQGVTGYYRSVDSGKDLVYSLIEHGLRRDQCPPLRRLRVGDVHRGLGGRLSFERRRRDVDARLRGRIFAVVDRTRSFEPFDSLRRCDARSRHGDERRLPVDRRRADLAAVGKRLPRGDREVSSAIDPLGRTLHAATFHAGVVELPMEQNRPPVQEPAAPNRQPRTLPPR